MSARLGVRAQTHHTRDFLRTQRDSEINACFLLGERSDLYTFQCVILKYKIVFLSWKEEKSLHKTVARQQRIEKRFESMSFTIVYYINFILTLLHILSAW